MTRRTGKERRGSQLPFLFVAFVSSWTSISCFVSPASATAPDKSGVKPQVLSLPSGPGSIEGLGGSFEPQLNTGTSAYNVSLAVPPGVNGFAPKLALTYDSGAGNGHYGIGWQLPLESIYRQFDKGQPTFTAGDLFVHSSGGELVPLSDGTFRFKNEADFMRLVPLGDGWEVRAKNGTIYRLGQYPNATSPGRVSRVQNPDAAGSTFDQTFKWYVDSMEDPNGNRIEFYYQTFDDSPGELYASEIRYNSNGIDFNSVNFEYEARDDSFTDYRAGFRIETSHRGTVIQMLSRGTRVREYRLEYESAAAEVYGSADASAGANGTVCPLRQSLLSKVTQYDNAGQNYLPPLRLGYTQLVIPTAPQIHSMINPPRSLIQALINGEADLLDVNGDGLPDVLYTGNVAHSYVPNLGRDRFGTETALPIGDGSQAITGATLGRDGSVLADMDGDGMTDLVREPGEVVFRNRGDGTWAPGTSFDAPPEIGTINGANLRFLDTNFDKAADIVVSADGQWTVCEHRADDFEVDYPPYGNFPGREDVVSGNPGPPASILSAGSWQCRSETVPFPPGIVFSDPSVQLADMNGDRIQDVVHIESTGTTTRQIRYWPGLGGVRFGDAVVLRAPNGGTEVEIGSGISAANVKLIDVNGDGLSDLVAIGNGILRFWINVGGEQWSAQMQYTSVPALDSNTALRFADMNGNGSTDLVWIRVTGANAQSWQYLDFMPRGKANQLSLIDNGLGRRISIEYATTTDYMLAARDDTEPPNPWTIKAPFPLSVVSRVVTRPSLELDGKAGEDEYVTDFAYRDAYYDGYEKQFRGFGFVKKIERGDDTAPTEVSRIWFHTGAPDGANDERTPKGGLLSQALKGRVLRQQVATADGGAYSAAQDGQPADPGAVFSTATNDWQLRKLYGPTGGVQGIATSDGRYVTFALNPQSETFLTERGQGDPQQIRTTSEYDDYGNVVQQNEEGALGRGNDERYTTTEFAYNLDHWILDRPKSRTVRSAVGETVTQSLFHYDGPAYVGLPLGQVEKGNLTREEAYVADGQYINKSRKKYDAFGNVVGIMDPLGSDSQGGAAGHLDEIAYDTVFHTFPVSETIHVGAGKQALSMTAEYDLGLGVMTASIDFNGHRSTYGHDSFGRLTSITKPFDTEALPTQGFSYHMSDPFRGVVFDYDRDGNQTQRNIVSPSFVETHKREQHGQTGTFDVRQYVDGMGRKLATIEEGETNFILKDAVRFNARGSARDSYQPFETSSNDYNLGFATYFTSMVYDATGREVQKINPPEQESCPNPQPPTPNPLSMLPGCRSFVTTAYRPLEKSVFDENNNEMTYLTDGLKPLDEKGERLVEVQEVNKGERYRTFYEYNTVDSLTRIEDAQNNVKVFSYDGLQRKTFMNDPDRGVMSYAYDDASNLIETIDAKGQRIVYTYDGVNRLLSEDYKDEGLPFSANRVPDVEYHYDEPYGLVDPGDLTSPRVATNTAGSLSWVSDLSGEEHNSYDERGRVHWVVKRICNPQLQQGRYCEAASDIVVNYKTEMIYDAMDRVVEVIYPDNDRVRYGYNDRSLPEFITGGPSGRIIQSVEYKPSGQQAKISYGNGVETTYNYDPRLRLIDLHTSSGASQGSGNGPLLHYVYTFDPASNITRIDDKRPGTAAPTGDPHRNTQFFEYDDLYRLTRVQYSFSLPGEGDRDDGHIDYAYDRIGDMVSQFSNIIHNDERTGLSVTNHGLMEYGGTLGRSGRVGRKPGDPPGPHALDTTTADGQLATLQYDDNGNVSQLDSATIEWDYKLRPISSTGSTMMTYRYDHAGNRVVKRANAAATAYINQFSRVNQDGTLEKYVFNLGYRVARSTAILQDSGVLVERVLLRSGWNLIGSRIAAEDALASLGADPNVEGVFVDDVENDRFPSAAKFLSRDGVQRQRPAILWVYCAVAHVGIVRGIVGDDASSPGTDTTGNVGGAVVWCFSSREQKWILEHGPGVLAPDGGDTCPTDAAVKYVYFDQVRHGMSASRQYSLSYYLHNHMDSTEMTVDADANVMSQISYYPFGVRRSGSVDTTESYLFARREDDSETGLSYEGARYLSPRLGRFISADPALVTVSGELLKSPQHLHGYAYAGNSPIMFIDPSGWTPMTVAQGQRIVATARGWAAETTAYALVGRASQKGIQADCSGSVYKIYEEAQFRYDHPMPDEVNGAEQFRQAFGGTDQSVISGVPRFVKVEEPQAGDVIVFITGGSNWTGGTAVHMGIYAPEAGLTGRPNRVTGKQTTMGNMFNASSGARKFTAGHTDLTMDYLSNTADVRIEYYRHDNGVVAPTTE